MDDRLTNDEFRQVMQGLKGIYPDPLFMPHEEAYKMWYRCLADMDYQTLAAAAEKYIMTNRKPPTPSDIRAIAAELHPADNGAMDDLTAWTYVQRAIRNGTYGAEAEYAHLPQLIQKAVGTPAIIREWAMMTAEDVAKMAQPRFLAAYRRTADEAAKNEQIPLETARRIKLLREDKSGEIRLKNAEFDIPLGITE